MLKINTDGMVTLVDGELRNRITKSFERAECRCDVDVRVVNTFVYDKKGDTQPYFRLRVYLDNGSSEDLKNIGQCFEILNMEMEIFNLEKVVHAKT